MAAVRLHEFSEGVIVPHEKTLVAPKADRLEVIKAVQANLSPIFGLYRDEAGVTARALDEASASEPVGRDRLRRRRPPPALARRRARASSTPLQDLIARQRIFIADGHHRYETALVYRRHARRAAARGSPADGGHHYILMFLCPMNDPGLFLFPTHRLVFGLKDFSVAAFLEALARYFTVETLPEDIRRPAGRAWAISKLGEHARQVHHLPHGHRRGRPRPRRRRCATTPTSRTPSLPANETLRALDVTVLHSIVLQHLLGLSPARRRTRRTSPTSATRARR